MSPSRNDYNTVRVPVPEQVVGGRYKLIERVGSGGMGLVFLGEQVGVGNKVAVKVLDPEPQADESRISRFLREGRVAIEVSHPGAAQLLDIGRDDRGFLYLVFEYVEGKDLREWLKDEGRLSFEEARTIALKVAEVLAFSHARGIVHRDVKPENIRVRRDLAGPHVKVLDFGIARLMHDQGIRLTAEGELAGTPRYMAPEQIRDAPVDARTDIYALGLVFFESLSGRPAFDGKNMSHVLLKQVQEPVPALHACVPELNAPAVDAFIRKACAKRPEDRFQTMEGFVRALMALQVNDWPSLKPKSPVALGSTLDADAISDTYVRPQQGRTEAAPQHATTEPARELALNPPGPTTSARPHRPFSQQGVKPPAPGQPAVPWDTSSGKKMMDEEAAKLVVKKLSSDLLPTDPVRPAVHRRPDADAPSTIPGAPPVGISTVLNDSSIAVRPAKRRRVWPWLLLLLVLALGGTFAALKTGRLPLPARLEQWLNPAP